MTIFIRNCILTTAVLVLPGCLAINALLGVAGFLTTGPIQYAGTAYSVGEYAYEYAVNDKTPDEVIGDKLAWLMGPEAEMEEPTLALAKATTLSPPLTTPVAPTATEPQHPTRLSIAKSTRVQLAPPAPKAFAPRMVASLHTPSKAKLIHPKPKVTINIPPRSTAPAAPPVQKKTKTISTQQTNVDAFPLPQTTPKTIAPASPTHEYIQRTADPLTIKLDRMEHSLAQAEQLMDHSPVDGIRYSVPTQETGQTGTTLSGSWSIRHTLMQTSPTPAASTRGEAVLITAQL